MKKAIRVEVYNETKGRCGYCGTSIEYKNMQVDHIVAQNNCGNTNFTTEYKMNTMPNFLCTCRKCNHYKRALPLESFRELINTLDKRLRKQYIFEVGLNFGITQINNWSGRFYFEIIGLEKFVLVEELIEVRRELLK